MKLTKKDVAALLEFASKDETRPWMCAVLFEPEHGRAVATDGHTLVIRMDASRAEVAPFVVPTSPLKAATKLIGPKDELTVTPTGIQAAGTVVPFTSPGASFPTYRQVLDGCKKGPCVKFGINPVLLARLEAVAKAAGSQGMVLETGAGELDPLHFTTATGTAWSGVIMPFRV